MIKWTRIDVSHLDDNWCVWTIHLSLRINSLSSKENPHIFSKVMLSRLFKSTLGKINSLIKWTRIDVSHLDRFELSYIFLRILRNDNWIQTSRGKVLLFKTSWSSKTWIIYHYELITKKIYLYEIFKITKIIFCSTWQKYYAPFIS